MASRITVDWNKCRGAGVCVQVCPMSVWDLEEAPEYGNELKGHPKRPEDCILCMACVNACPNQAIEVEEADEPQAVYIKK
ncbi:ferredoxin family protein [Candidatus Bathyarchaeota archaeon]|nr:ferredoxin family protein [Candidatus Bathyarchaeota archaeon]